MGSRAPAAERILKLTSDLRKLATLAFGWSRLQLNLGVKPTNMMLRRFWFPLDGHLAVGVTATSLEEATTLADAARRELWPNAQPLGTPVQDVDIGALDRNHVVHAPNGAVN